ncbi:F-box protein CPR30-like [Chenopodium quinoa]|uniref:F-box protein CPR30-like n=1 Tax=Chenopodium quinoa TaxID=63459 RepID=UPI000B78CB44|nr:F-box protein CPR30-like [Chenopodium quinoa]
MMKTKEEKEETISPSTCYSLSKFGSYLPEDLITEILLRSPVKSLVRFKSMCKDWSSIITNPNFTKTQFHHSSRYYLSLSHVIFQHDNSIFILHLDLNDIPYKKTNQQIKGKFVPFSSNFIKKTTKAIRNIHVFGSCNGILFVYINNTMYLWNPTTDEYRVIPSPPNLDLSSEKVWLAGFGYASTIDDYKIVLVIKYISVITMVYVYSTRLNKWRNEDTDFFTKLRLCRIYVERQCHRCTYEAIISNDALHWTLRKFNYCRCHQDEDDNNNNNKQRPHFIFKFDMVNEIFQWVFDLNQIHSSDDKLTRKVMERELKIRVDGDGSLYVYLQYNESYHYKYWSDSRALLADVVEMWVITKSNVRKKFRLEGRWNNIGNNHEMIKITGNGKVIVFRRGYSTMENLVIFDGRQPNKRFYIEATSEYGKPYDDTIRYQDQRFQRVVHYSESLINPKHI